MKCQCEDERHFIDGPEGWTVAYGCQQEATVAVPTISGTYQMCQACADELPAEFKPEEGNG